MTARLQQLAPTVMLLEGGYNFNSIAVSSEACLRVLLGAEPPELSPEPLVPSESGLTAITKALATQVIICSMLIHAGDM